ncbi:MAG: hypothetical protein K0Q70_59 [Rhodospirillales bacterium]|jgi:hypothetical protein|nr:hypothetical protein [Rhodospirillales bacterium]
MNLATLAFALALVPIGLGLAAAPAGAEVAAPDHIVVFDAPDDFPVTVAQLGFTKVETLAFQTVSINGYRVRVPNNESAAAMIKILKTRYPSATVDSETTEDFTSAN